jgi:hypothetical protein
MTLLFLQMYEFLSPLKTEELKNEIFNLKLKLGLLDRKEN